MRLQALAPDKYLGKDEIVDHDHPDVQQRASELRHAHEDDVAYAKACFEFVRDQVAHSWDVQDKRVTLSASEALREGVGLCYSKAHLLTALLRAGNVPAGLCYQRLTDDGEQFDVHGLIAVYLDGSWHRQDPRGNKPGVDAQFSLAEERLAWPVRPDLGECDYTQVFVSADPLVVEVLSQADDVLALCGGGLPDRLSRATP